MRTNPRTMVWLCAGLMTLGLSACAPTQTGNVRTTPVRVNATVAEAAQLARQHDSLNGQARSENGKAIERLLGGLDNPTLSLEAAQLPAGDPLYNFMGRELQRRGLPLPRPFDHESGWRFNVGNRLAADRDGYHPPRKLAVLLPLSGNLAVAASPVRDGLLAGYYGEHRARPEIVFYDTAGTADGAVAAYQKASGEGADYVVGPLGRDEVGALFKLQDLPVPLLALNRTGQTPPSGNASFALAPEDDGIAAAEYLLSRKASRVLVLVGDDDSQIRSVAALREQLGRRGGSIVQTVSVADKPVDSTAVLQAAAQKDGGVDAVFFALKGPQARTMIAQLATAGLGGKLKVGTSQLVSGTGKPDQDKLLDGIAFPSDAWSVQGAPGLPSADLTGKTLITARGPAARLFAFGYDAWQLTGYLEKLVNDANGKLDGATGTLRIDGFGNIMRTPAWSTFSNGLTVPLARSGG